MLTHIFRRFMRRERENPVALARGVCQAGSSVASKKKMRDILLDDLTNDPASGYNESVNAIINFITDLRYRSGAENAFVEDCRKVIKKKCK